MIKFLVAIVLTTTTTCATASGHIGSTQFVFEPSTTAVLPQPLSDFTASQHRITADNTDDDTNGEYAAYVAGGCNAVNGNVYDAGAGRLICNSVTNAFYKFDGTSFSTLANMPISRYRHAAVSTATHVWVAGGRGVQDDLITTVDVYTIADDTWQQFVLPEQYHTSDNAAFAGPSNEIFFVGGYNVEYAFVAAVWAIDTVATLESGNLVITEKEPLAEGRGDISGVAILDETNQQQPYALVTGGFGETAGFCAPTARAEKYNFVTNTWTTVASMAVARSDKALVAYQGKVLALGGERQPVNICELADVAPGELTVAVDDMELYHADADHWEILLEDLPSHRFRFAAVSWEDEIYVLGGQLKFEESCNCTRATDAVAVYREETGDNTIDESEGEGEGGDTVDTDAANSGAVSHPIVVSMLLVFLSTSLLLL